MSALGPLARLLTPIRRDTGGSRFAFAATLEPWPRIYGGQLLGQACAAAGFSVTPDLGLHSFHAYFLRGGNPAAPVDVDVDRVRDGQNFVVRHINVHQKGETLLEMTASYHVAEAGWSSEYSAVSVPQPDTLDADRERVFERIGDLPRAVAAPDALLRDIEYRIARSSRGDADKRPERDLWVRVTSPFAPDRRMREAMIAYLSDFTLIGAALLGHRAEADWRGIQGGSLDHALWLHRDPDPAQWLHYRQQGIWTGGARGLAQGMLFSRDGTHVATLMQEALVRPV